MTKPSRATLLALLLSVLTGFFACGGTTSSSGGPSTPTQTGTAGHVVIVLLENTAYSQVIGSSSMPYLNSLANQYSLAANYFAFGHPSIPNYFMLTAGQPVTFDDNFSGTISDDNIARELNNAGRSWKVYAEGLPSTGYMGGDTGLYLRHHNPFVYFSDVANSSAQQKNVVPFTQFSSDLSTGSLPSFSFVVPNEINDAHSCPASNPTCTVADRLSTADAWLQSNLAPLLSNSAFASDGLLIITFDESVDTDIQNGGGHVAMVLVGPLVKRAFKSSTTYDHPSTLHMILKRLGITTFPGASAGSSTMDEFFTNP